MTRPSKNDLAMQQKKHKKTNTKSAQGWFTSLGGNPEVEKDFFNRTTTFNSSDTNLEMSSSGDSGGEASSGIGMGESFSNSGTIVYKGYEIDCSLYKDNEFFVQYQNEDYSFDSLKHAKEFIDNIAEYDDTMGKTFGQYRPEWL